MKKRKSEFRLDSGASNEFWITKGLRQGWVLSPILFCLYIAGLEKVFKDRNIGGIKIGGERIWTLAYADDIVLLVENREALLDMCGSMKKFINERKLILSAEKTKVLVFNKGGNMKKEKWKQGKEEIEEVKVFKYLGFVFNCAGNYKDHIAELRKKGTLAAKLTWGLREKRCKGDFRRRLMLYNYLVRSVIMEYGEEIWGWEEKSELEKIKIDYVRWILRLVFCTPKYIIYMETCTKNLALHWGDRAVIFEEKIAKQERNRLTKICWDEKNQDNAEDLYNKERENIIMRQASVTYIYG